MTEIYETPAGTASQARPAEAKRRGGLRFARGKRVMHGIQAHCYGFRLLSKCVAERVYNVYFV